MDKIIIVVLIALILLVALYVIAVYNKLIKQRNRVKDSWAQIDVELKRRFDLIPNIVETVKGYASHESETLKGVIEARNKFNVAKTKEEEMKAYDMLNTGIKSIFALAENYPDLKANQNFLSLQDTLKETENKVAVSRNLYNDSVLTLNNLIMVFPSNIVAKIFNFKEEEFFKINEEEASSVKVNF